MTRQEFEHNGTKYRITATPEALNLTQFDADQDGPVSYMDNFFTIPVEVLAEFVEGITLAPHRAPLFRPAP